MKFTTESLDTAIEHILSFRIDKSLCSRPSYLKLVAEKYFIDYKNKEIEGSDMKQAFDICHEAIIELNEKGQIVPGESTWTPSP